jgi:hypothetical protein
MAAKYPPELKALVAEIINVESTPDWDIYDTANDNNLVLVHYNPDADMLTYSHLRGVIIDVEQRKVVCRTFNSYTSVTAHNVQLVRGTVDGKVPDKYMFKDDNGSVVEYEKSKSVFYKGHEGAMMRVFKNNGKIYTSTHKRINPSNNWWSNSPIFTELYNTLNGPTTELFDPEQPNSPFVYLFLMMHPSLSIASREDVSGAKLYYVGYQNVSDDVTIDMTPSTFANRHVPSPERFDTLDEVNSFLISGYYPAIAPPDNPIIGNGEFVILVETNETENKRVVRSVKIQSHAYRWRTEMRNNESNLKKLVFKLAAMKQKPVSTRAGMQQFENRYPFLVWPGYSQDKYVQPVVMKPDVLKLHGQRWVALSCLLYATPPHLQHIVRRGMEDYLGILPIISNIIINKKYNSPDFFVNHRNISEREKAFIVKRMGNIHDTAYASSKGDNQLFGNSVHNLVEKEYGENIYLIYSLYTDSN